LPYTVEEAAAALGIGNGLIYDEARTGRFRSKKAGVRRVIGRLHLLEWLDGDSAVPSCLRLLPRPIVSFSSRS